MTGTKSKSKRRGGTPSRASSAAAAGRDAASTGAASATTVESDAMPAQMGTDVETGQSRERVDIEHGGLADGDRERPMPS